MKKYLVGGAIRDELLNLPVIERDWVIVGATSKDMIKKGYQQVGKDFPVFIHPKSHEEYALARTERKIGKGHKKFNFFTHPKITLEEDLRRRDLTINAIAKDEKGNLIDPYQGKKDIQKKILRHISKSFCEDPLRILRVARFAAKFFKLNFQIATETFLLMKSMVKELIFISPERIWRETEQALSTDSPHIYFQVLRNCGALKVIFPEINSLFKIPETKENNLKNNTGAHTMLAISIASNLSKNKEVRFSVLCHDVGKIFLKKSWFYHDYESLSSKIIENMCSRLRIPKSYSCLAKIVAKYHKKVHHVKSLNPKTLVDLFNSIDVWRKPERLEHIILSSESDMKGRLGCENYKYSQKDYLKQAYKIISNPLIKYNILKDGFTGKNIYKELNERRRKELYIWKKLNTET